MAVQDVNCEDSTHIKIFSMRDFLFCVRFAIYRTLFLTCPSNGTLRLPIEETLVIEDLVEGRIGDDLQEIFTVMFPGTVPDNFSLGRTKPTYFKTEALRPFFLITFFLI